MSLHARESRRAARDRVLTEVVAGLLGRPKRLPSYLLYDERGSELFEAITLLPEYYLTRMEVAILRHCAEGIASLVGTTSCVVELGAGTATKTRLLLDALLRRQAYVRFVPIDVSAAALARARRSIAEPRISVESWLGRYEELLACVSRLPRPRLALFLGSSIGNYEPQYARILLSALRAALASDDALVIGMDVRKDPAVLLPAYDDAAGVTASFDKNVLAHLNRLVGTDFEPELFRHVALWNDEQSRVEMYLESTRGHAVTVPPLRVELRLDARERIHTENSYKLPLDAQLALLDVAGFTPEAQWVDERGWYAVHLARVRS